MKKMFEIYHTANAGLLIKTENTAILLDALYQSDNDFDPMSDEVKEKLFEPKGMFTNVDCLLFTHGHYDHYDYQTVRKYIRKYPNTVVAAPEGIYAAGGWTEVDFSSGKIVMFTDNQDGSFKLNDMEIAYYRTPHMGFDFPKFGFHYSFIVRKENAASFISGDTQLTDQLVDVIRSQKNLKAAFFNPIVLQKKKSRELLRGLDVEHIFIYHLPQEQNDRFLYRESAVYMLSKYENELPNVQLLLKEMEEVSESRW